MMLLLLLMIIMMMTTTMMMMMMAGTILSFFRTNLAQLAISVEQKTQKNLSKI